MLMRTTIVSLLLLCTFTAWAKDKKSEPSYQWQTATVLWQRVISQQPRPTPPPPPPQQVPYSPGSVGYNERAALGASVGQAAGNVINNLMIKQENRVIVETSTYRYEWLETAHSVVILPVNGRIQFYQDGKFFVVLDDENHKHKFELQSVTAILTPKEF